MNDAARNIIPKQIEAKLLEGAVFEPAPKFDSPIEELIASFTPRTAPCSSTNPGPMGLEAMALLTKYWKE